VYITDAIFDTEMLNDNHTTD